MRVRGRSLCKYRTDIWNLCLKLQPNSYLQTPLNQLRGWWAAGAQAPSYLHSNQHLCCIRFLPAPFYHCIWPLPSVRLAIAGDSGFGNVSRRFRTENIGVLSRIQLHTSYISTWPHLWSIPIPSLMLCFNALVSNTGDCFEANFRKPLFSELHTPESRL